MRTEINQFHDLFASPVFETNLKLDNEKIKNYCYSLEERGFGRIVSNIGGFQSMDLISHPDDKPQEEIQDLLNDINSFASDVCNMLEIHSVRVYNMWGNINRYRDFNWPHTHSDSILSGVYYVKTPPNCGNIEFENPALSGMNRSVNVIGPNRHNSGNWWLPSQEGKLYIFPGWFRHAVKPNLNKTEDRVSISFNLFH